LDGKLHEVFPRFPAGKEIPHGSFVVVAYVSQLSQHYPKFRQEDGTYNKGQKAWKFSAFVQWAIVIGVSQKHILGYSG
jgi:hypothetical protein